MPQVASKGTLTKNNIHTRMERNVHSSVMATICSCMHVPTVHTLSSCLLLPQLLSDCGAGPAAQGGQQHPHRHWLYWAKLPADDFPVAAMAAPRDARVGGDSSSSRLSLVAGACDLTTLKRSLLQQLFDAAPGAFKGPAAGPREPAAQAALQAAADAILLRVRQSGSAHGPWVQEALTHFMHAGWRQQQETYLRLVSMQPVIECGRLYSP